MIYPPKNKGLQEFFDSIDSSTPITLPTTSDYNRTLIPDIDDYIYAKVYIISKTHYPLDKSQLGIKHRDFLVDRIHRVLNLDASFLKSAERLSGPTTKLEFQYPIEYFIDRYNKFIIKVSNCIWGLPDKDALIFITESVLDDTTTENRPLNDFIFNYISSNLVGYMNNSIFVVSEKSPRASIGPYVANIEANKFDLVYACEVYARHIRQTRPRFNADLRFFDNLYKFPPNIQLYGYQSPHKITTKFVSTSNQTGEMPQAPMSDSLFQAIIMSVGVAMKERTHPYIEEFKALAPNLILLLNLFAHKRPPLSADEPFYMCSPKTLQFENQTVFDDFVNNVPYLKSLRDILLTHEGVSSYQGKSVASACQDFTKALIECYGVLFESLLNAFSLLQDKTPAYQNIPNLQNGDQPNPLNATSFGNGFRLLTIDFLQLLVSASVMDSKTELAYRHDVDIQQELSDFSRRYRPLPATDLYQYQNDYKTMHGAPELLIGSTAPLPIGFLNLQPIVHIFGANSKFIGNLDINDLLSNVGAHVFSKFKYSEFIKQLNEQLCLFVIPYDTRNNN